MNSPQVGTHVHFYPHGASTLPYAAIVTHQGTEGCVKLTIFPPNSAPVWSDRLVHYTDDPWVEINRRFLIAFDGPCPRGTWDFMPGGMDAFITEAASPVKEDRKATGLQKVREYAEQGLSPREIAPKVRQYGISTAEVEDEIGVTA